MRRVHSPPSEGQVHKNKPSEMAVYPHSATKYGSVVGGCAFLEGCKATAYSKNPDTGVLLGHVCSWSCKTCSSDIQYMYNDKVATSEQGRRRMGSKKQIKGPSNCGRLSWLGRGCIALEMYKLFRCRLWPWQLKK